MISLVDSIKSTLEHSITSVSSTFTAEDIKELYRMRWGIETSFRGLKYIVGLVNLHGKRDAYAEQEIYATMTMFNFTSRIVREVIIFCPIIFFENTRAVNAKKCKKQWLFAYQNAGQEKEEVSFPVAVLMQKTIFQKPIWDVKTPAFRKKENLCILIEGKIRLENVRLQSNLNITHGCIKKLCSF